MKPSDRIRECLNQLQALTPPDKAADYISDPFQELPDEEWVNVSTLAWEDTDQDYYLPEIMRRLYGLLTLQIACEEAAE